MAPRVAEILADGRPREGCEILHGGRIGGCGGHDDRVVHRPVAAQCLDERGDGRCLLADSYIDAINRVARLEAAALVDDRVDGDRRLTGLTVADNQLALSAADGNHRIDGLQTRL